MIKVKRMLFRESPKIVSKLNLISTEEFYVDYGSYVELKKICVEDSKEEMSKVTRSLYGSLPAGSVRGGYMGIFNITPPEQMEDLLDKANDGIVINVRNSIRIVYGYTIKMEDGSKLEDDYTVRYSFHAI